MSDCYCCYTCDKHKRNVRRGYIIPCDNKYQCAKYCENLAITKANREADTIRRREEYEQRAIEWQIRKKRRKRRD